jgi:hypothetical protein
MTDIRRGQARAVKVTATVCFSTISAVASASSPQRPQTTAVPMNGHPIRIDGRVDEAAWQESPRSKGFWQREPRDGEPAEFPTEFWTLYDDNHLYVAIRAYDPQPDQIRALLTRRDEESSSDWVIVGVDSFFDRRTAFHFAINPSGVLRDYMVYDDNQTDASWDAVWEGAATVDDDGWTAEMRIPFSQLRFDAGAEQTWGFQVGRVVQRTAEYSFWSPWPRNSSGQVSLYGELSGLRDIEAGAGLEVTPYAVGGGEVDLDPGGENRLTGDVGLDFKVHLTNNLLMSGAINPDFGQVEADPSDVNLSEVETFFPEKRPFFMEGFDLFRLRLSQGDGDVSEELFYSRRIGAAPSGELDGDEVGPTPRNSTILGAVKLIGRSRGGWSYGAFNALTDEESGRWRTDDGDITRQILEPFSSYSVLALRKDFDAGRTKLAGALTGVHRRLSNTGLASDLHEQAYSGGVELSHKFWEDNWGLSAKVMGSHVRGAPEAIDATQTDSPHYFQRPDASHVEYDPSRTSLSGFSGQYRIGRDGGEHIRGAIGGETRSPGFEINDLGFQTHADSIIQWAWLQYRDDRENDLTRHWRVNLNGWASATYGGEVRHLGANLNGGLRTRGTWELDGGIWRDQTVWDVTLLRGGPRVRGVGNWGGWAFLRSDTRLPVWFDIQGWGELRDGDAGFAANLSAEVKTQVGKQIEIGVGPFWKRNVNDQQYVDTIDNAGTYRYLIAHLDQTTLGVTLRLAVTFTPNLSLQAYAQPFFSNGAYRRFREVTHPHADRYADRFSAVGMTRTAEEVAIDRDGDGLADYRLDTPDFGVQELRSNVVLRWEYLPGSALFVVWSHAREREDELGRFDLTENVGALGRKPGEHVFLVKLSYRFEV